MEPAARAALAPRRAVVLVGDSEGDVTMADGLEVDTVLKIGFLNYLPESPPPAALVARYATLYDLVLLGDARADAVEELVRDLLAA
jgi:hypothetical protein